MISAQQQVRISKFLSLVLRHKPEIIAIHLDQHGWADVDELLEKINASGIKIDRTTLDHIVATNPKKRFSFNAAKDKIRASQGHSLDVALGYINQEPPEILYHGTGAKSVEAILKDGIEKQARHHVHLSNDIGTANQVGRRHGKPVVLKVYAKQMYDDHFEFFISDNGVWLTDNVPSKYLELNNP
jgi:putative RNA 2'-phosphotransferase